MFYILRQHYKLIIIWGLIVAALATGVTLLFPRYYSAVSQVLIISRDRNGVDPYTQVKSAERIGENMAQVMKTTDFFKKVMDSAAVAFDREAWNKLSDRDQRKEWQKNVKPEMIYSTSLLRITVYGRTPDEALHFGQAVTQVAVSNGWEYVGGDVALKEVDNPLVSRWSARPNVALNAALGFAVGVLAAALWIVEYKRRVS